MYINNIYENWDLHQHATQSEKNYKYFLKVVDIMDVKCLIQYDENSNVISENTNSKIIEKWQINELKKVLLEYDNISNISFPELELFDSEDIYIKSLFRLAFLLNLLKKTNYKASQLETYYEPRIFELSINYLDLSQLQLFMVVLCDRITGVNYEVGGVDIEITWEIVEDGNIKNHIWMLDNLSLSFKEISGWYNEIILQVQEEDNSIEKVDIITSILNHKIIYALSDFYIKYLYEINSEVSYVDFYNCVLFAINNDLENKRFALLSFKYISIYFNFLINNDYIEKNDDTIKNFISILKISCSESNKNKLIKIINEVEG